MIIKNYSCHYGQTEDTIKLNRKNGLNIKTGNYITCFERKLHYHSSEELKFIKVCEEAYIDIQNGQKLAYELNNKSHYYWVDFESDRYVFEIKASRL